MSTTMVRQHPKSMQTARSAAIVWITTQDKGLFCPAAERVKVPLATCVQWCASCTHQWGHHGFARWRDDNP